MSAVQREELRVERMAPRTADRKARKKAVLWVASVAKKAEQMVPTMVEKMVELTVPMWASLTVDKKVARRAVLSVASVLLRAGRKAPPMVERLAVHWGMTAQKMAVRKVKMKLDGM